MSKRIRLFFIKVALIIFFITMILLITNYLYVKDIIKLQSIYQKGSVKNLTEEIDKKTSLPWSNILNFLTKSIYLKEFISYFKGDISISSGVKFFSFPARFFPYIFPLLLVFAVSLVLIERLSRKRVTDLLTQFGLSFEKSFRGEKRFFEKINLFPGKELEGLLEAYNSMVERGNKYFLGIKKRINSLIEQIEEMRRLILFYKKNLSSEKLQNLKGASVEDIFNCRQMLVSLSIELVDFLKPIQNLYPKVITKELDEFNRFIRDCAAKCDGLINYSYGYFINVVLGIPEKDDGVFERTVLLAREVFEWVETRNTTEKNISGVNWDIKMGLSFGSGLSGEIDSEMKILGEAVENSNRMLQKARFFNVSLVTDNVEKLKKGEKIYFRKLDRKKDKNVSSKNGKYIYELFLKNNKSIPDAITLFNHGLDMFFKGKYDVAISEFKKVDTVLGGDNPSRLFLKRCEKLMKKD